MSNPRVNLSDRNEDYAVFLPSISSYYNNFISRQQHDPNAIPASRIPAGFENGLEGCNFLNEDQGYFTYKWGLYSAGHAQLDTTRTNVSDSMIQNRDRSKTFILGDSGGFQICKGVIKCDWPHFKTDDSLRHTILNWLEHTSDYSMILDVPTSAADPLNSPRTGITTFDQCLDYTDFNTDWFVRNRKGQTKYLNVMQGRSWAEAEHWYDSMKKHDLEGFAFGGETKTDINIVLRMLLKMRDEKQLEPGKRDLLHYLGNSKLEWAVVFTAIKRALRETVNPNIEVMYDCATPFISSAKGTVYSQPYITAKRFNFMVETAFNDKTLHGSKIPFPWTSPIGSRLNAGDICHYAPGMLNKNGKESMSSWDALTYVLFQSHNTYQHIETIQKANALVDMAVECNKTSHRHWRKLKANSKEEVLDPFVPRDVIYVVNFIRDLFRSEKPYELLEEAAPLLASFNGTGTLKTADNKFNALFATGSILETSDDELEQAENAEEFLDSIDKSCRE